MKIPVLTNSKNELVNSENLLSWRIRKLIIRTFTYVYIIIITTAILIRTPHIYMIDRKGYST
jgi:hypothetical protein